MHAAPFVQAVGICACVREVPFVRAAGTPLAQMELHACARVLDAHANGAVCMHSPATCVAQL